MQVRFGLENVGPLVDQFRRKRDRHVLRKREAVEGEVGRPQIGRRNAEQHRKHVTGLSKLLIELRQLRAVLC